MPLEPNHTHFIFVDDGTKHENGGEAQFRTQFERAISGKSVSLCANDQSNLLHPQSGFNIFSKRTELFLTFVSSDSIPVVLVVIEGKLETIKEGYHLSNELITASVDYFSA